MQTSFRLRLCVFCMLALTCWNFLCRNTAPAMEEAAAPEAPRELDAPLLEINNPPYLLDMVCTGDDPDVSGTSGTFLGSDTAVQLRMAEPAKPLQDDEVHTYYQYITPPGELPYALFTPVGARDGAPIPLIISLHGASEVGRSEKTFRNKFLVKEFRNWESTGLDGINAYIVCPHLSGGCNLDSWNNPKAADLLFDLIDDLVATHNIDANRIAIQGHSLGGQGALYMAAQPRARFCAVAVVSGYEPYTDLSQIHTPIRGYIGTPAAGESRTSSRYMKKLFGNRFGSDKLFIRSVSHDQIPITAFREDLDGNHQSDLVEWMFSQ